MPTFIILRKSNLSQGQVRKQGGEEKRMTAMTAATNSEPGVHHPIDSCRLNDNIH